MRYVGRAWQEGPVATLLGQQYVSEPSPTILPPPCAGGGWGGGGERPVNTLSPSLSPPRGGEGRNERPVNPPSLSHSPQGRGNATHARAYPSHDSLPPCGGRLGRGG